MNLLSSIQGTKPGGLYRMHCTMYILWNVSRGQGFVGFFYSNSIRELNICFYTPLYFHYLKQVIQRSTVIVFPMYSRNHGFRGLYHHFWRRYWKTFRILSEYLKFLYFSAEDAFSDRIVEGVVEGSECRERRSQEINQVSPPPHLFALFVFVKRWRIKRKNQKSMIFYFLLSWEPSVGQGSHSSTVYPPLVVNYDFSYFSR